MRRVQEVIGEVTCGHDGVVGVKGGVTWGHKVD